MCRMHVLCVTIASAWWIKICVTPNHACSHMLIIDFVNSTLLLIIDQVACSVLVIAIFWEYTLTSSTCKRLTGRYRFEVDPPLGVFSVTTDRMRMPSVAATLVAGKWQGIRMPSYSWHDLHDQLLFKLIQQDNFKHVCRPAYVRRKGWCLLQWAMIRRSASPSPVITSHELGIKCTLIPLSLSRVLLEAFLSPSYAAALAFMLGAATQGTWVQRVCAHRRQHYLQWCMYSEV